MWLLEGFPTECHKPGSSLDAFADMEEKATEVNSSVASGRLLIARANLHQDFGCSFPLSAGVLTSVGLDEDNALSMLPLNTVNVPIT